MALSDYIERLRQVAPEGPRATDFATIQSQRGRTRQQFLEELKLAQQRAIQFEAEAAKRNVVGIPGTSGGGGGGVYNGGSLMYPLKGNYRTTSQFGSRTHPISGKKSNHTGIDWAAPKGTPIYAPADATVRSALFDKIYGNQTILDLGGGRSLMFGHQSAFNNLKAGQAIRAGQIIGYVGSTGWSTGPHLHFETWQNNRPVNPLSWFR